MATPSLGFPRSSRLRKPEDFRRVFSAATRSTDAYLTLLARINGTAEARLGFAISRKAVSRAVNRNRIKRLVREDFRLKRKCLAGLDIVVMARSAAVTADRAVLASSLNRHWKSLLHRCAAQSSSSSASTGSC